MHYASKTASASRGIPAAHPPESQWVFRSSAISCINPKSGRWRKPTFQSLPCRTGHKGRFVRGCWKLRCKKTLLTFRMSHGFDFATQNLGAREEFSHLIRKEPAPPRKTVGFPKTCGNFSTKPRPTTPKAKVVRPEQIRVTIFPQKSHPEARQTAGMCYNI